MRTGSIRNLYSVDDCASIATVHEQQANEFTTALALRALQGLAADEVAIGGLEGDGPGETRFQGMEFLIHVVAVQIHAGFQPQGISGPERPGGRDRPGLNASDSTHPRLLPRES